MTQRIRGISDEEATGAVKDVFDASNKLLGRTANLLRILAHSPYLARWFLPLDSGSIAGRSWWSRNTSAVSSGRSQKPAIS